MAVAEYPQLPIAHYNLGYALSDQKRIGPALACFENAIRLNPDYIEARMARADLLVELNQYDSALNEYEYLMRILPGMAEPVINYALLLKTIDRPDDALEHLNKALQMQPKSIEAYLNRANLLVSQKRYDDAIADYLQVLKLDSTHINGYVGLAHLYKLVERYDNALHICKIADSIRSSYPSSLLQAEICAISGDFENAEHHYKDSLTLDRVPVKALCGLSEIKKFAADDPFIAIYRRTLERSDLNQDDRSSLLHAYGKICNDIGHYDDAVACFVNGKALRNSKFNMSRLEALYSAMISSFSAEFIQSRKNYGIDDTRPIFVVGMPRSGTTLVETIIASHPHVQGLGELELIPEIFQNLFGTASDFDNFEYILHRLTAPAVKKYAEKYIGNLANYETDKTYFLDKLPQNFEYIGLIKLLFPNAKIIHCLRNPLDCLAPSLCTSDLAFY